MQQSDHTDSSFQCSGLNFAARNLWGSQLKAVGNYAGEPHKGFLSERLPLIRGRCALKSTDFKTFVVSRWRFSSKIGTDEGRCGLDVGNLVNLHSQYSICSDAPPPEDYWVPLNDGGFCRGRSSVPKPTAAMSLRGAKEVMA